jgi:Amt family ammonium transporter
LNPFSNAEGEWAMLSTDYIWMIVCACFVFFMQAGFVCYEVGFAQSKNVVSITLGNCSATQSD